MICASVEATASTLQRSENFGQSEELVWAPISREGKKLSRAVKGIIKGNKGMFFPFLVLKSFTSSPN